MPFKVTGRDIAANGTLLPVHTVQNKLCYSLGCVIHICMVMDRIWPCSRSGEINYGSSEMLFMAVTVFQGSKTAKSGPSSGQQPSLPLRWKIDWNSFSQTDITSLLFISLTHLSDKLSMGDCFQYKKLEIRPTSMDLSNHEKYHDHPSHYLIMLQFSADIKMILVKQKLKIATMLLPQSHIRGGQIHRIQLQQGPSCTRDCLHFATLYQVALLVNQLCKSVRNKSHWVHCLEELEREKRVKQTSMCISLSKSK